MAFPRAPKKPVRGQLKLSIRPAETEVTVGEEEVAPEEDYSEELQFRMPPGFQKDESYESVRKRMFATAHKSIDAIEEKQAGCTNCRKKTLSESVQTSRLLIDVANTVFRTTCVRGIGYTVGQEPDGDITVTFRRKERVISTRIRDKEVGCWYYLHGSLVREETPSIYDVDFLWLIGERDD